MQARRAHSMRALNSNVLGYERHSKNEFVIWFFVMFCLRIRKRASIPVVESRNRASHKL